MVMRDAPGRTLRVTGGSFMLYVSAGMSSAQRAKHQNNLAKLVYFYEGTVDEPHRENSHTFDIDVTIELLRGPMPRSSNSSAHQKASDRSLEQAESTLRRMCSANGSTTSNIPAKDPH